MTLLRFDLESAPLDQGTVLLEASAGTGKTYTLVGILLRLLLERRIERLDQALVVTFTVAATAELKNRLRAALLRTLQAIVVPDPDPFFTALAQRADAERLLRQALDDFDLVSIATIHGFCKRLLDEAAFESHEPFTLDFAVDPVPLFYRAAADTLRGLYSDELSIQGVLMHTAQLTPQQLVEHYRLWQRYPDVHFAPDPADPAPHLRALADEVTKATAAFDAEAAARITGFHWGSGKSPFAASAEFGVARLQARLASSPLLALPDLLEFAPTALEDSLLKRSLQHLDHPFFAACDAVLAAHTTAVMHLRAQLLRRMHERLEADKRRDHVLSFQDLLSRTHTALHDPERRAALLPALRARYLVGLIDEFQDTDSLQYGIFAQCFAARPLFLIGDPKQSIYGFRGADLRAYLAARDDAVQKNTLDTNRRSAKDLVRAVGQLFDRSDAFVQPGITMPTVQAAARSGQLAVAGDPGAALRWRFLPAAVAAKGGAELLNKDLAEERIAADVAAEISRLLRAGVTLDGAPLRPRHMAVLTRTNKQAVAVQDALRRAGIVSAIGKAGDVFATEELVELERFLIAVLQPGDQQRARAAMATRLWGLSASALAALDDDEAAFDRELARLDDWRRLWIRRGFVVMKEQMLVDLAVQRRLLATNSGERRLTNFQQLFELLHDAEHGGRLSPEGLLEWLQHERRHQEELDYQLRELRLESDEDAAQILTVHGSKGMEYEIVFCPFLWDSRLPARTAIVPADPGRELVFGLVKANAAWHAAETERLAEDVRLCYVALTRARRRCYVHWGAIGSSHGGAWRSALAWLLTPGPVDRLQDANGAPAFDWLDKWASRVRANLPQLQSRLTEVVDGSGGAMDCGVVPATPEPVRCPPPAVATLRPPLRPRPGVRPRALHSFSSLCADGAPGDASRDIADRATVAPATAEPPVALRGIFAFARGPEAGQCLHAILEQLDFGKLALDVTADLVATTLQQFGLDDIAAHRGPIEPVADVLQNLRDLALAQAHEGGPTIGAICSGRHQAEWQFMLPTAHSELRHLADLFAGSTSPVAVAYADRLRSLPSRTLRGFLVGFVDLVAEHDGRYWVLDWKSNHLGPATADYGPAALATAMRDHDYVLQYHLYVLALHRHLRSRLPDYDYDRHVGGICYTFLRGAVPGSCNGMVFDRVPRDLVQAMDRWADGQPVGGRA